jgi:hypothetical protein
VAGAPDTLVLERHRDLEGRHWGIWVRRAILGAVAVVSLLGLANVFGQRPVVARADAPAASLELYAPEHVRGGLIFMARFTITAHEELRDARLVLDEGWAEGITINTIEPSPLGEASVDGRLSLDLGHVPAGDSYVLFMDFQVNPTNVGRRPQDVELYDGDTLVLRIDRTVTVFP